MNHHRLIAGITAAFVIVLAAILIFHQQLGIYVGPTAPAGTETTGPVIESPVQTATTQTPEALAPEFAFRRLEIDTSKPQAEACLVFTRTLDETGKTHYGDYLKFDPQAQTSVRVNADRLCIAGLGFNQTYTVTLKSGLPSARGEKLAADETVPVELRDRPPIVRFEGGILLPRDSVDGVPVTTVNIAKLKMKILRVGDRLLSQRRAPGEERAHRHAHPHSFHPAKRQARRLRDPGRRRVQARHVDRSRRQFVLGQHRGPVDHRFPTSASPASAAIAGSPCSRGSFATAQPMANTRVHLGRAQQQRLGREDDRFNRPRRFHARIAARRGRR